MHPVLIHAGALLIPSYGVLAAIGILLALFLSQRTARLAGVDPNRIWNLSILALFAALIGQRLILLLFNWNAIRSHPAWALALGMIHHPLLAAAGAAAGLIAAFVYMRRAHLPIRSTADALAAPLALGLACEQAGAFLAGSGFGIDADPGLRWAVTYSNPFAGRWSGTPLGVPLHPVQLYAALAFLVIAAALFFLLPRRRQPGDIAGLWFYGMGTAIFITEFWRDPEGRGSILGGAINGPQIVAVLFVFAGAALMRRQSPRPTATTTPVPPHTEPSSSPSASSEPVHE